MAATPTLMRSGNAATLGQAVVVQEGESCNLVFTPTDVVGAAIVKANLITLKFTLFDLTTSSVVNSRNDQSVIDANQGAVDTAGVLTMRLGPLDTVIVGTNAAGSKQVRCVQLNWTFNDGVAVRTGKSDPTGFEIQKLAAVT